MMKIGIVTESKPGYAKVYFKDDDLVTDFWPVLVKTSLKDFESWPLNVQEHVVCVTDERCEEGVVLGAIHSKPDPPDSGAGAGKFRKVFEDGTVFEYDKIAHKARISILGDLEAAATGKVSVSSGSDLDASAVTKATITAPSIEITGTATVKITAATVNIMGNAVVSGSLTAASIATSGGGPISAGSGDIETTGQLKGGQVVEGGVRLGTHKHAGVQTGGGSTGPAIP